MRTLSTAKLKIMWKNKEIAKRYNRKYYLEHQEQCKKNSKMWFQKNRREVLKLLGDDCLFCDYLGINVVVHRKDGKVHKWSKILDTLKNIDDYALLCPFCHKVVHWIMEQFGFSWEQIIKYKEKKNAK